MVEISQQEFENYVKDLINKKITRVELAKKLETDTRTLANKIYAMENETLLEQYINVYPYKPGKNENIDYEALIIEIVKRNASVSSIQEKYGIAERTYRRNIERIQYENQMLYTIYKHYIKGIMTDEEREYIDTLEERRVSYSNSIEDRKAQLMQFFLMYDELIKKGLTEKQALLELGESTKSLKRKNDELKRILEDEKISKKSNMKIYKDSLKVNTEKLIYEMKSNDYKEELTQEIEGSLEGDEK